MLPAKTADISKNRLYREIAKRPGFQVCLLLLGILVVAAIFAPYISPYDPEAISVKDKNQGISSAHLFGTDFLGRDLFSLTLWGARTSLLIASISVAIALIFGSAVGCVAGYYGGVVDEVLSRFVDLLLAFPGIIFALALLAFMGAGILNLIIAITLSQWAIYARLMRGQVISIKNLEYVQSAYTAGLPDSRIMTRHLFPNAVMPVLILSTIDIGHVILSVAGLSFLGLGIPPGIPEWGSMIGAGKEFLRTAPLNVIVPGLAITFVVLIFNYLGEGLRDILDVHKDQVNIE
ncbi:MAG: ABC transporter permease [Methanoregula sp.]|nr:ABC transporter permease [Methanoregula sp.]